MESKFAWIFLGIQMVYLIIGGYEHETKHVDMANLFFALSMIPGALAIICFGMSLHAH